MKFGDVINSLYRKTPEGLPERYDTQLGITFTKWTGFYSPNLKYLKKITPYIFYLEPKHYFYLLYCSIPKISYPNRVPFVKKPPVIDKKENPLLVKLQYILGWSNRDLECNMPILEQTVLKDEEYWKRELGVK